MAHMDFVRQETGISAEVLEYESSGVSRLPGIGNILTGYYQRVNNRFARFVSDPREMSSMGCYVY